MDNRINKEPIFVLCHARSGSTLLRYILDTHSLIYSPSESHNIQKAYNKAIHTRLEINYDNNDILKKELIYDEINETINKLMQKKMGHPDMIWCDKSISTIEYLPFTNKVFPNARFICLYRHCLDFVHSAIEVIRFQNWKDYGFYSHIKDNDNIIDALVVFWCDKATTIINFEKDNPSKCFNVMYESLIKGPYETINNIFQYLNVPIEKDLMDKVFNVSHEYGGGDHKIKNSIKIEKNTVGKGRLIPLELISQENILKMNKLLKQLNYPEVKENWNSILPTHLHYGVQNRIIRQSAISMVKKIFKEFDFKLKKQLNPLTEKCVCLIEFKDLLEIKYLVSSQFPFISEITVLNDGVNAKMIFDFNTFIALLNNQINIENARFNCGFSTEGDVNIVANFLFLFR